MMIASYLFQTFVQHLKYLHADITLKRKPDILLYGCLFYGIAMKILTCCKISLAFLLTPLACFFVLLGSMMTRFAHSHEERFHSSASWRQACTGMTTSPNLGRSTKWAEVQLLNDIFDAFVLYFLTLLLWSSVIILQPGINLSRVFSHSHSDGPWLPTLCNMQPTQSVYPMPLAVCGWKTERVKMWISYQSLLKSQSSLVALFLCVGQAHDRTTRPEMKATGRAAERQQENTTRA